MSLHEAADLLHKTLSGKGWYAGLEIARLALEDGILVSAWKPIMRSVPPLLEDLVLKGWHGYAVTVRFQRGARYAPVPAASPN